MQQWAREIQDWVEQVALTALPMVDAALAPYGFSLTPQLLAYVIVIVVVLAVFIATSALVALSRLFRRLAMPREDARRLWDGKTADRLNRLQAKYRQEEVKVDLHHRLHMQQYEARIQRLERSAERRFTEVGFAERLSDRIQGLVASTAPGASLPLRIQSHFYSVDHASTSFLRRRERTMRRHLEQVVDQKASMGRTLEKELAIVRADEEFIDQLLAEVSAKRKQHEESDSDETAAKKSVEEWKEALGRPVFAVRFLSFFERNVEDWRRSQGHEAAERSLEDPQDRSETRERSAFAMAALSIWQWLRSDVFNVLRVFPYLALPVELLFSYPIFQALTYGNELVSIAGATVFTFGIFTLGELTGKSALRSRQHRKPEAVNGTIRSSWRIPACIATLLLVSVSLLGIYFGAALRQNAGEVLRVNDQVTDLRAEVGRQEERLTAARNRGDEATAADLTGRIAERTASVALLEEHRSGLLAAEDSPFARPEGRLALFIFGVFFIATVARQTFDHDPVFEYSQSEKRLSELQTERLQKLLVYQMAEATYGLIAHGIRKRARHLSSDLETLRDDTDLKREEKRIDESGRMLEQEISSYVHDRCMSFCKTLSRFRGVDDELARNILDRARKSIRSIRAEVYP